MRSEKKKEQVDRQDKQRRSELEERQFGKTDRKDLDKVVICREDRRIISVVRRRGEIRRAVLEEKACVERARESGEEVGRKPQTLQSSSSESRRTSGGEESRRQTGWKRRAHVARWNRIRQPSALITANGTIAN